MSTNLFGRWFAVLSALLLGGCATFPSGPSVMVLPGTGKNFDQFRVDDYRCRQYALEQVGGKTSNQAALESGVTSAAVGTALGAAAGAVMGGNEGAGFGAGAGLLMGSLMGADAGQRYGFEMQQVYDAGYIQCMYAYGHLVPVSGQLLTGTGYPYGSPVSGRPAAIPPPPPGPPPPPPPGVRRW